jgi:predicted metal-binding protein
MSRPTLFICRRCEGGETLHERVRALRKAYELKPLFKVRDVKCLKGCDGPCAVLLKGQKRSTYLRVEVRPTDAVALVEACAHYARLLPGEELPERLLVGEEG